MLAVEQEYSPCLQQGQERAGSSVWTNPRSSTRPWISCGKDSPWYSVLIRLLWLSGANLSVCLYVHLTVNILSSDNWMFVSLVNSSLNHIQNLPLQWLQQGQRQLMDLPPQWQQHGKGLWCTVTASGGRITFIMPDNAALDSRLYWLVPWMQFRAKWLIKWQFRGNSFLCRCRLAGWILSNQFIITLSV